MKTSIDQFLLFTSFFSFSPSPTRFMSSSPTFTFFLLPGFLNSFLLETKGIFNLTFWGLGSYFSKTSEKKEGVEVGRRERDSEERNERISSRGKEFDWRF